MKLHKNKQADLLVLERGEELLTALEAYAKDALPGGAWLQSGLGGADSVTLSFYDLASRQYIDKVVTEPLEIISLQGNLAWIDSVPFWHVHGVFGDSKYQSFSGHVKQLRIALTAELLVVPLETKMTRIYDETTGLKLLDTA